MGKLFEVQIDGTCGEKRRDKLAADLVPRRQDGIH